MKNEELSLTGSIKFAWEKVTKNLGFFIPLAIIYFALTGIDWTAQKTDTTIPAISIIQYLLNIVMAVGITYISLQTIKGEKTKIEDLFIHSQYFLRFLLGSILYGLIVVLGLLLLVVPGIVWGLKYSFISYIFVDKDMSIADAFRKSAEITAGKKLTMIAFYIMLFGVLILGALALGVGLLIAVPVTWVAGAHFYRQLEKLKEKSPQESKIVS